MSYASLNWAWKVDIPSGPKMVLVALADQAGYKEDSDRTETVAGQGRLAAMVAISVRSVGRHMAWLEEQGLITRETRRRPDGYKTSDVTVLNLDTEPTSLPAFDDNLSDDKVSGDNVSPDNPADLTGQTEQISPDTVSGLKKNPPVRTTSRPGAAQDAPQPDPSPTKSKRGTRLPDPFTVSDPMRRWAFDEFPWLDLDQATDEFRDYWRAVPGGRGVKLDWTSTWRNAIRKTAERVPDWRRKQLIAERRPTPRPVPGVYPGDPDDVEAYVAWINSYADGGAR